MTVSASRDGIMIAVRILEHVHDLRSEDPENPAYQVTFWGVHRSRRIVLRTSGRFRLRSGSWVTPMSKR